MSADEAYVLVFGAVIVGGAAAWLTEQPWAWRSLDKIAAMTVASFRRRRS